MDGETVNFYSGQPPLNRLSFQRPHADKLNAHLHAPGAKFVLFHNGGPLVKKGEWGTLLYLSYGEVEAHLQDGFQSAPDSVADARARKVYDSARAPHTLPTLVFLGLDDRAVPAEQRDDLDNPRGDPVFALDTTKIEGFDVADVAVPGGGEAAFGDARGSGTLMAPFDAGVFALARPLVDWNARNKFCPACGARTYSLWGGWKRACSTALAPPAPGSKPCFSTTGLHNFAYPRTDPVIIMGILDQRGERMLLGRQKAWPAGMYSCLAGFIEPGESFEDAVRREVLEEAGVVVGTVAYSSSQPWPYPANVMVGCFGRAADGQAIRLDLDNELEDAQFFPRDVVAKIINDPKGSTYSSRDLKKIDDAQQDKHGAHGALDPAPPVLDPYAAFTRVPPESAIAGQLMRQWVAGKVEIQPSSRL